MDIKATVNDYPLFEIDKEKVRFHYDVSDPEAEHSFWTKAVNDANYNRNYKKLSDKICEELTTIDIIAVRTVLDYFRPDDNWFDWNTDIWIGIDNAGNRYYFLKESYLSPWDEMPVYSGGEISQVLFNEYMKRINNHKYDQK